ncbi:MAG: DNA-directed RNA polymerase subunit D [Candidatus Aenigmatarchaeota archaeon]
MKVKILSKKREKLEFLLEEASPAFANALRRIMVSEVPTLAVEWIDVALNGSILFDEVVAHRLGMIPLVFDPKKFNFTADCKCGGKGCPVCQVVFALDKTGPCIVHSGDLKSSNREVKPADPRFPIVELLKGQQIQLEAIARLGTGGQHAKWQAANVGYQYYPELVEAGEPKAAKLCPKGALKLRGKKVALASPEKCNLCEACFKAGSKIAGNDTKFIFRVESVSGLEPKQILSKATEILSKKAEEFKSRAAKL